MERRKTNRQHKRTKCKNRIVHACVNMLKQRMINDVKYKTIK